MHWDDYGRTVYPPKDPDDPNAIVPMIENHYDDAGRMEWVKNERGYKTSMNTMMPVAAQK